MFVDLDVNRIHMGTRAIPPFPARELQQITWELERVVKYRLCSIDYPGYNPTRANKPFTNFIPPEGPAYNEYLLKEWRKGKRREAGRGDNFDNL